MLDRLLPLDDSSLWFAVDVGLKATLLLAIAAAMTVVLRAGSAAVRHRVWTITFAALLLLPLASGILPEWNWRVIPRDWQPANGASSVPRSQATASTGQSGFVLQTPQSGKVPVVGSTAAPGGQAPFAPPTAQKGMVPDQLAVEVSNSIAAPIGAAGTPRSSSSFTWLSLIWLAGALAALLPLITGIVGNLLFKRRGRRLVDADWQELLDVLSSRLGLRRKVALLVGGPDQMPMTFGWLHPYVVLPSDATNWQRDQRQAVLLHELAHVKRGDVPLQMIARAGFALYWFHPLAWLGIRRMRLEREHACDDCVLLAGQKASSYAAQLLEIARAHRATSPLATAALSMARPSQLEGRLLAVLDSHRTRAPLSAARGVALALSALVLVVGLGILRPTLQAENPKSIAGEAASAAKVLTEQATAAADADGPVTVSGILLSPLGKPVVGGLIEIIAVEDYGHWARPRKDKNIRYYSINSDSAGRFETAVAREVLKNALLELFASADGLGTNRIEFRLDQPHQQRIELPALTLLPPKTFRFQLLDTAGNAATNVSSKVWGWEVERGVDEEVLKSWPRCSRSGEDGGCSVVLPAQTKETVLLVENERFGCQLLQVKLGDDPIGVVLKPGRFLSGQVVAVDTGRPLAGAEVLVDAQPYRSTRTDNDGGYRITVSGGSPFDFRFRDGETIVQVYPPADSPYMFHAQDWRWPNNAGGDAKLTIKMEKGIVVEGDVFEKGSGKAVVGASIYFEPQEYNNRFFRESAKSRSRGSDMKYQTDTNGHFRLPVWPGPGYVLVKAPSSDYLHVMVSMGEKYYSEAGLSREYHDGAFHLDLKPDESAVPIKIELQRGVTLRRKVVRPDGQPAQGAAYARSYLHVGATKINGSARAASIEDGVLELPGFDPDHSNPLFVIDLEHHCGAAVSPPASEVDLTSPAIQLRPTGSASFRFLNDRREVLRDYRAEVELIVTPGAPPTHSIEPKQPLWADVIYWRDIARSPLNQSPKTDSDGLVVIHDLIPGATYRLGFVNQKGNWGDGYEFTVRSGETTNVGDVTIPTHE